MQTPLSPVPDGTGTFGLLGLAGGLLIGFSRKFRQQ